MSGAEGGGGRKGLLASLMGTLSLRRSSTRQEQPKPMPEDLGLKTLRHAYSEYARIEHPVEKERQLHRIIPLFCQNCSKFSVQELETRFPEVLDFAEQISLLFVRHVTQIAHPQITSRAGAGLSLLKYFELVDEDDTGSSGGVGLTILKAIHILSNGSDMVVTAMMTSNLCSVLVQCINLFLELPHPAGSLSDSRSRSSSSASPATPIMFRNTDEVSSSPSSYTFSMMTEGSRPPSSLYSFTPTPGSSYSSEMSERQSLERLLRSVLDRLVRHMSAVSDLIIHGHGDLSLLFGAVSRPCPTYNKMWKKTAADCLIAICRYSLSSEVIDYIHKKGCIMFCMRTIQKAIDQPPLDVVESIATIFSCLKDSAEISQVLLEDFSNCRGYKFLHDYLLYLERKTSDEAREVLRNVVLLIQGLVMAGFLSLEPTITDGGPFQDPGFQTPAPLDPNHTVRNKDAFIVLQDAFIASKTSHLGITIIDAVLNIFRSDMSNYFIVQPLQSLSYFVEKITEKKEDVQAHVFKLFEFVMLEINYVATAELTSIGLLLTQRDHPQTLTLVLNFLLRLISYSAKYKMIFAQVGILTMMINALKVYANELKEAHQQTDISSVPSGGVSSPSLPLEDVQGAEEEYVFLLMECLRATIEGNEQNGDVFRENGGTKCALTLVNYNKPRRLALRLLTQLILLKEGSIDFSALLDLLNQSSQTAVLVKAEVFQTILRIFQLDSSQKGVFREVCGFHYLISVLASLIGSLAPRRSEPWIGVPRVDILHLVQLIFAVLTSAMHDDPANRSYFEINIRFQSFTAPLLLLGCFDNDVTEFPSLSSSSEDLDLHSGSFTSFESEFKTWHPPSKDLSQDSAIYCASEVFRFLRDMSLGIQSHQSTSLIDAMTIGLAREKSFYGAPPVTAARQKAGNSTLHLQHPGAVLCMVDLLPAVGADETYADDAKVDKDGEVVKNNKEPLSPIVSPDNRTGGVPDIIANQLSMIRKERKKLDLDELDVEHKDLEKEVVDDECHMTKTEARSWSIFLQERVVSEIYSVALSERNQQALCQIGLPQRILAKCSAVLSSDCHPLHEALERTFEKLSYQSLTPSDFRSFLRLGNPLCCSLNDITVEDLRSGKYDFLVGGVSEPPPSATPEVQKKPSSSELEAAANQPPLIDFGEPSASNNKPSMVPENEPIKVEHDSTNKNAPFGGSLSLARVQSLVSMTTPRDGNQEGMIRNPPFVEFDLSIDGFACLFLPSVFPQSISQASSSQSLQSPAAISGSTSGVGTGSERPFPPSNGLTFSCWLHFTRCSQEEKSLIGLLTLAQTLYLKDRKLHHLPCLRIYLHPEKKQLVATTCQPDPKEKKNSSTDEVTVKTDSKDKMDEAVFRCSQLFQEHCWHHIVVVINKGMRGRAKVTLFINGQLQETRKMTYIHPLYVNSLTPLLPYPNENTPYLINAFIGTHVTRRSVSKLTYRLGSVFLFEDPLPSNVVQHVYTLGPSYYGSFQAPVLQDRLVSSLVPGSHSDPLPPLIPEEKVVFGLLITCPLLKTIHELTKAYSTVDVSTIARELSLAELDNITPITLLHNSAAHLLGPSRTLGAIMCGYSGIRFFEPQPLRSLISSVGGTSVVLGLVAMATTVDNLYASMKALVCIIGDNQVALKEMERTGGFQVLGMLLHSKAHLINSHILHLTYTLVGTVDSERSATISNPIAFRDLLANMLIWRATSETIQRSLFNHFYDLLSHNSNCVANAEQMIKMKLVSTLLYHLIMENLCVKTIKLICNVLSTLIALKPEQEDITRIGQLLATTLPSNRATNENSINLYDEESLAHSSEHEEVDTDLLMDNAQEKFGRFSGTEGKQRRAIILRNILLEVVLSLIVQGDGLNSSFIYVFNSALGFDWLMLFMDTSIHAETVSRAVRILIQLLTDPTLRVKFHEGDIFGGWVQGFDSISSDMSQLLSRSVSHFNPLKPSTNSQLSGASVMSYILPHHAHVSHLFLLLVASLLGKSSTDIPFSSQFNTETLEDLFSIGDTTNMAHHFKIFTDAAYVLLALTRSLLHQESSDPLSLTCAVDLIKFLTRLYRHVPEFTKFASSQEFVEALASTLFPPPLPPSKTNSTTTDTTVEQENEKGDSEWILIETQELPGAAGQDQREAILKNPDNLAVCTVVKLLRTIAVNGFSSTIQNKESAPACPIFERVLAATPAGISTDLQNQYQTLILHSIVEYLKSGNEDILILLRSNPHLSQTLERSILGLSVFCSRLVDKVWQDVYLKPVSELYSFFYALVEQARKIPKELPLGDMQRCLNRIILFQVSTVPASEDGQKQLMDTLCMFSSQAHCIFDDTNFDNEFLECLTFCLLKIVFAEKVASRYDRGSSPERRASDTSLNNSGEGASKPRPQKKSFAGYIPGSIAMMKSGANRLWTKMLEYKRKELEQILSTELPTPTSSNRESLTLSLTGGPMAAANSAYLRLQNCEHFLTDSLIKSWDLYIIGERSSLSIDSVQKDGRIKSLTGTLWPGTRISRKRKGTSLNSEVMVQDYVEILCPLLVLAAQKYFETMLRNYQRNEDYRLRYAASEWSKIEYELTRERGLWGPEIPAQLDKWMLDTVEGPSRMRKRMCINHNFCKHYPYQPRRIKVKSKHQKPSSHDSELLYKRELLFQRPTLLTTSSIITTKKDLPRIMSVSVMDKEPPGGASHSPAPSPAHGSLASSRQMNEFTHPDTDDPIAQTIYRMFEPEDKVNLQYRCATLNGLDSRDGVLLLGTSHFYVIEGLTINKYGEIVDIETAHEDSYQPVVPLHLRTDLDTGTTTKRQISIQCIKWSYDTIREIHKRRYLLRRCAIEVFSSDGRNHFLIFHSQERNKIYQKLQSLSKQSLADSQFVAGIHPEADPEQSAGIFAVLTGEKSLPERWANGEITNFQYLMHLNTLAGRSYNDLMQYPIFPWVLANYSTETLDLSNPSTFRDFSKPMGAQDPVRLKRFMERYKYFEDPTGENTPPYYYGTHYSSAMIVASFLIRMEPFTQHFLKLQGGHFDLPDRLFHSIPDAWRSASETNMADVKELIPEFFYLPEFLTNTNHFELGMKQSGVALNDIVLPPWAKGDPQEFIRMHREALECDYVSAHLHEWIDLIFGYKQTGEEALKAHNVFHHLFYEGAVDIDKIEDPVKRNATISFIHNFGQMPKQLFKRPHRQRKVLSSTPTAAADSSTTTSITIVDSTRVFYKNLIQLMPSKDPIKEIRGEVNQMVSITDKIPTAVEKNKLLLPPNYNRYFMWGFPDYSARIATVEGDKVTSVFEGLHEGRILCSAAADDNILLTGGESTVVCVWKIQYSGPKDRSKAQLQLKHTLYGHTGPVTCLAASTSYNLILSGSKDKTCILWDINRFTFVQQLSGHSNPVTIVTINQLNGNIVTCTRNQIRLWTVTGTLLAETDLFYSNNFRLLSCTVSELFEWDRENVIVTGSSDGIIRLWVLEYIQEEEELKRRRLSRKSSTVSENEFDSAVHGDRHLPVVQNLRRSITPPTLTDIKEVYYPTADTEEGQTLGSTVNGRNTQPISNTNLDNVIQDFSTQGSGAQLAGNTHEELHSNRASSLSNLPTSERNSTLGVSDLPILSTSTPSPSSGVGDLIDLSSTGITQPNWTGIDSVPHPPIASTSSAISDNVFDTQSDTEEAKAREENGTDDVFTAGKEKESNKVPTDSSREEKAEDKKPTYDQLLAEQRKREELRHKGGKWIRKLTMVHQLTMHTSFHRKDNDNPASVTSLCISKDHRKLFVGDAKGRIFSWSVSDNLGGMMEHWLRDEAINNCMKCNVEFTFTERKHHCRDCGKIFCAKCSGYESEIERLRINKKVRICGDCFSKLTFRTK